MENQQMATEDVIDLRELLMSLWQGKVIIAVITAAALLISIIASFFVMTEHYETKAVLNAQPIEIATQQLKDSNVIIDSLTKLPSMTMDQYIQQVKSTAVLEKTVTALNLKDDKGNPITAGRLSGMVTVTNADKTNIIEITVKDTNGQRAANIANELSRQYIQHVTDNYNEQSQQVLSSITEQSKIEKQNLDDRSAELTAFIEEYGSIELLKAEADDLVLQIVSSKARLSNLEAMIESDTSALNTLIETAETELGTDLSQYLVNVSLNPEPGNDDVSQTPQDLIGQLQLNLASDDLGRALQRIELNRIQMRLLNSLTSREAMLTELEQFEDRLREIKPRLADLEFQYNNLISNLDSAKLTYQAYELKLREAQLSIAADVAESSVTITREASVPGAPTSPNKKLNLAIGLVLGLMLGVFVVLFRAYWKKDAVSNA
jgi:capsular polysaccharide biosynthesis protein